MLDGNRTPATKRRNNGLFTHRVGSMRRGNTSHTPNVKWAHQHALGNSLRIVEAEFVLVRSQMPALPDWQSISALTDTESFYSD
jgi:hypothetical protein